jgi:hypothetical protein
VKEEVDGVSTAALEEYAHLREQHEELKEVLRALVMQPIHSLPFLKPGRLAQLKPQSASSDSSASTSYAGTSTTVSTESSSSTNPSWADWGVVVNFQQRPGAPAATSYVVDMLLPMRTIRSRLPGEALRIADSTLSRSSASTTASTGPTTTSSFIGLNAGGIMGRRLTPEEEEEWTVAPVAIGSLYQLSSAVLYMPKDLRLQEGRLAAARGMKVSFLSATHLSVSLALFISLCLSLSMEAQGFA